MLALIEKIDNEYIAQFNRSLNHAVEQVWAVLTENDKLARWMPNLYVENLRKGGIIKFDMMDGSGDFIDINILDCQLNSVLEFNWGKDRVRFEVHKNPDGCLLILKEFIHEINEHTPKDLSGWHICLEIFSSVLDGHDMDFPKDEWEKWYKRYKLVINKIENNDLN
ncbi:SRPBCC family protein [Bacillus pseudomycoides]|uniref:SRPBCC family protein n=1 Tax=Bacillus pseudomycoides TaxID=64104 RepID=UPI000BEF3F05|nr:SRPBCC family protein [Bacillus pseudomycoides]PEJ39822.1 activator of Hsp90 ATPase 1 family protein [Bacillus pseudomycoides]PHA77012.1 activator of Hsp90 ATPase 1 family protein [Bacillus pseudomycoides]PHC71637.1 activator of Hsp90 ATPase 1 family protein [Bacillus pseudomycoides]